MLGAVGNTVYLNNSVALTSKLSSVPLAEVQRHYRWYRSIQRITRLWARSWIIDPKNHLRLKSFILNTVCREWRKHGLEEKLIEFIFWELWLKIYSNIYIVHWKNSLDNLLNSSLFRLIFVLFVCIQSDKLLTSTIFVESNKLKL